jgi:hypothetical protein
MVALSFLLLVSGCSREEGLIGLWQTKTTRVHQTADTNLWAEQYETVEFLKDGSYTNTTVLKASDGKQLVVPMGGTYSIIGSNHLKLEIAPSDALPQYKIPFTVSFSISNGQLTLPAISASVVTEYKIYRKVKK